jgi:hypothetical protein
MMTTHLFVIMLHGKGHLQQVETNYQLVPEEQGRSTANEVRMFNIEKETAVLTFTWILESIYLP